MEVMRGRRRWVEVEGLERGWVRRGWVMVVRRGWGVEARRDIMLV
jgi:hypothetical protein